MYEEIFKSSKKLASDKYTALAVNNLHVLAESLEGISSLLEFAINATPTGAVRNLLTDANILAKKAINDIS